MYVMKCIFDMSFKYIVLFLSNGELCTNHSEYKKKAFILKLTIIRSLSITHLALLHTETHIQIKNSNKINNHKPKHIYIKFVSKNCVITSIYHLHTGLIFNHASGCFMLFVQAPSSTIPTFLCRNANKSIKSDSFILFV